jgi:acetoin utilization deacetylase AcuC-like enzyme
VFYCDTFTYPLPDGHRFPAQKYRLLRERVAAHLAPPVTLRVPEAATDAELSLAHDDGYVKHVRGGELDSKEVRRIGLPWSPELVERTLRSVGGTLAACRAALSDGVAVSLSGGTHHAFRDRGEGFCVFNDAAVAARAMQAEGGAHRVAIVDCDVHQGNGTAAILADDDSIFTLSIHGAKNFPFHKERSDLDIELPDGTGDAACLHTLEPALEAVFAWDRPDLVIYLAGADPYCGDSLGRLSLSKAGLAARDAMILDRCLALSVPLAVVMAGGYARPIEHTVDIHAETVRLASALVHPFGAAAG